MSNLDSYTPEQLEGLNSAIQSKARQMLVYSLSDGSLIVENTHDRLGFKKRYTEETINTLIDSGTGVLEHLRTASLIAVVIEYAYDRLPLLSTLNNAVLTEIVIYRLMIGK
jgi:hypothetical protein